MNTSKATILLVTKTCKCTHEIKEVLKTSQFRTTHTIVEAQEIIKKNSICLVLVEDIFKKYDMLAYKNFLSELFDLSLNRISIIIVEEFSTNIIKKYIQKGFTYIATTEVAQYMIPAAVEYLEEFKFHNCSKEITKYKSLKICPSEEYIVFKDCKIFLSKISIEILNYLSQKAGHASKTSLKRYLEYKIKKPISDGYLTMNISRINQKLQQGTGLKIIKCRYGLDYYLDL